MIGPRAGKSDIPVEDPRTRIVSYESDNGILANTADANHIPSDRVLEIESITVGTLDHAKRMLNVTKSAREGFEKDVAHPMEMKRVLVEEFGYASWLLPKPVSSTQTQVGASRDSPAWLPCY